MLLLLSEKSDISTDKVIDWIPQDKRSFRRFNLQDFFKQINFHLSDFIFEMALEGSYFSISKIDSFWYRRGDFSTILPFNTSVENAQLLSTYLNREWKTIKTFLHGLEKLISLGSFEKEVNNNKISDLYLAQKQGLSIPNTLITSSKNELIVFRVANQKIISKPLKNSFSLDIDNQRFETQGTQLVEQKHIDELDSEFFPTFFQECVEKAFEIRSFYMKGQFYSMAIFSQNDEQTKIDYRNYNREKPNRNVPFQLPKEIEEKLEAFMQKSGLDTGSIDLIKATDGRYVFLEVNPVGQFDWVSTNCNYYIEEKIAYYLTHGEHATTNYG